jgi:outer membrane receptor protein involved in Fe transport
MERNIQFRGNGNVNILINGRPSNFTGSGGLDQLPAAMIDRIEVISNPSAKYDPDGTAGIINIITRNAESSGLNGTVSATLGTREKYTSGVYLNYKTKKASIYSNVSALSNRFNNWNYNDRKNFYADTSFHIRNNSEGFTLSQGYSASLGADIDLNSHHSWGCTAIYGDNTRRNFNTVLYQFSDENEIIAQERKRENEQNEIKQTLDASAYYRHTFDKPGHTLMFDFSCSLTGSAETMDAFQQYTSGPVLPDYFQHTLSQNKRNILTPQVNYTRPLKGSRKFEAGLKSILREIDQDFSSEHSDNETEWFRDTTISNHVVYNDKVFSAYSVYSGIKGKFGYSLGLRAEKTFYTVDQRTSSQKVDNSYFNIFPTAHLKYQFNGSSELGISFSRRINRPSIENLNPFPDWRDPYNLQTGNPYLRPEYTNSYELALKTTVKKLNINSTVFYRQTDSSIARYRIVSPDGISTTTFDNIARQWQLGGEVILQYEPRPWVNMNLSFNGYYQLSDAGNLQPELTNRGFGGSSRYMANFKFWKSASAQVIYNYNFPFIMPQGTGGPGHWLDLGIKKEFLKDNRFSLSLRYSDVFNTRWFTLDIAGQNFTAKGGRKRESSVGYFALSYRFGKNKPQQPKKGGSEDAPPDPGM